MHNSLFLPFWIVFKTLSIYSLFSLQLFIANMVIYQGIISLVYFTKIKR